MLQTFLIRNFQPFIIGRRYALYTFPTALDSVTINIDRIMTRKVLYKLRGVHMGLSNTVCTIIHNFIIIICGNHILLL